MPQTRPARPAINRLPAHIKTRAAALHVVGNQAKVRRPTQEKQNQAPSRPGLDTGAFRTP